MIALTAPLTVANVTRIRGSAPTLFDEQGFARITVTVLSPGATPLAQVFEIAATNGSCTGIRKNPTPSGWNDLIQTFQLTSATAYDQVEAAYRGAGSKAVGIRAVEAKLLELGIIDASLAGTVS